MATSTHVDETAYTERGPVSDRGTSMDMKSSYKSPAPRGSTVSMQELDDSDDDLSHLEIEAPRKLKADTDATNFAFE